MSRPISFLPASEARAGARLPASLLAGFIAIWAALAIAPRYPAAWLLENLIVFAIVPLLAWSYRRLRFSDASYVCLIVFFVLHEVGAHYTYAQVPLDRWSQALFGVAPGRLLGLDRNPYDRLIHFAYGLLATPASIDIVDARAAPTRLWRWMFAVAFISAQTVLYELVEWAVVHVFSDDLGVAYLSTQGDPWDAQKDLLLALLGSMLAATVVCRARRRPPA